METLKIRSSVRAPLMWLKLIRGTLLAGLGAGLIIFGGTYVDPARLQQYGWLLIVAAFALITLGMLPYRRLRRLEAKPNELVAEADDHLLFITKGKTRLTIPIGAISELTYIDREGIYGIGLLLNSSNPDKVMVQDSWRDMDKLSQKYRKRFGCDLFFPYFSRNGYESLQEWLFGIDGD